MKFTPYVVPAIKTIALVLALFTGLLIVGVITRYATRSSPVLSIVKVLTPDGTGGGTGWITESLGKKVIVTNDHVCGVEHGGLVRIEQDDGTPSLKRVLKRSFTRDLCIVEGVDGPALRVGKTPAKRFDKLFVVGHPGLRPTAPATGVFTGNGIVPIGFPVRPTPGFGDSECPEGKKCIPFEVSDPGYCPPPSDRVQSIFGTFCVLSMELGYTTVPIMPGNSGSPVTNSDGEVIGVINSADSTGNQGMFVPLNYLKELLEE